MKICFVGMGSIGRRHMKNLVALLEQRHEEFTIDCLRSGMGGTVPTDVNELVSSVYYDVKTLPYDYDVIFITNPTSKHDETLRNLYAHGTAFFLEKPAFLSVEEGVRFLAEYEGGKKLIYVACPLRYTGVIRYLKQQIDFSKVYSVRCISSSYLPEWRNGIDYRETYSASRELGGGVALDLVHEWDYLKYLMGSPKQMSSYMAKVSQLEIDSEDIAIYMAHYGTKFMELHLDYFGRETKRSLELFCENKTIFADITTGRVCLQPSGEVLEFPEDRNQYQVRELETFLGVWRGEMENPNDLKTAIATIKLAKGMIE